MEIDHEGEMKRSAAAILAQVGLEALKGGHTLTAKDANGEPFTISRHRHPEFRFWFYQITLPNGAKPLSYAELKFSDAKTLEWLAGLKFHINVKENE